MIHKILLAHIRAKSLEEAIQVPIVQELNGLSDVEAYRKIFSNYRGGKNPRGIHLSKYGLELLRLFFKDYVIVIPEDERITPNHFLYLEINCDMPYHYSKKTIVLFDAVFAVKLRLVDGRISFLVDIDGRTR